MHRNVSPQTRVYFSFLELKRQERAIIVHMFAQNYPRDTESDLLIIKAEFDKLSDELKQNYHEELLEPDFALSRLLLSTAIDREYDFSKLKSLCLALEFFNLALRYHTSSIEDPGLAIILGDYSYAKGISLSSEQDDVEATRILANAIKEGIANGQDGHKRYQYLLDSAVALGKLCH
ncbi:MAG: hypothetical protein C4562_01715 [Actinobacteria bacterium]|nr:MAG: hypothetical protein C4562_01715 [Actinomycetota bacterium]